MLINVVGDGPISVAKSDVGGVYTYTVSVKTDGKVESGDTGIVTGGNGKTDYNLSEENKTIKAENAQMKAEIQALKEALVRLEAKIDK